MKYYIVDAFAQKPFGGNPAGVVLLEKNESFPEDKTMIKIAAELRYSETAFVQQNGPAEFTIRYFTPAAEVDLCGHATIASFSVLMEEGITEKGTICTNHTLAGDLQIVTGDKIMMEMAKPETIATVTDIERLHKIMFQNHKSQQTTLPVQVISTGLPDIIMPVANLDELEAINPDMAALSLLSKEMNVVGVHVFALSKDGYTAHVRNFAPLYDIPEESATGTANAALTYYLYKQDIITSGTYCSFMQGESMERPSVIETELKPEGTVFVGGNGYILAKGTMFI